MLTLALTPVPASAGRDRQAAGAAVHVSTSARALRQGDVILVTVDAVSDVAALEGSAFGHALSFWRAATPRRWQALAGIPLDTKPGRHTLVVRTLLPHARTEVTQVPLEIGKGRFDQRHLTVDGRFADPPATEVERLLAEARRLDEIFASASDGRYWSGRWRLPVPGNATSSFGRLTFLNGKERGRHQGADFRASTGTPIRAPNGGVVALAQDLYFSGNTVVLDHGSGLYSLFAHLSRVDVRPGMRVTGGDVIGRAGATGRVTGPHLHWAVRVNNVSIDPLSLVDAAAASE